MRLPWQRKQKEESKEPQHLVDDVKKGLQSSIAWKRAQGYYDRWPEYERYKRGDQWPTPKSSEERVYPRPVINIFETIIDQKVSAVTQEEQEIVFLPREGTPEEEVLEQVPPGITEEERQELFQQLRHTADDEAAGMLTKVAKHTHEETGHDELCEDVCETAALTGTGVTYWYWDPNTGGGDPERETAYEGEIAGEEIDPADLHVANPKERDIQKQPWVIITTRTPIKEFREYYREYAKELGVNVDEIQPTEKKERDSMYDAEQVEMDSTEYIDEIRRFRKVYNEDEERLEVWYEVIAGDKLVRQERPLFEKSSVYPVAVFRWKKVKGNFFGEGEGPNLIEVQKSLNRLLAMAIWNGYLTAWAKMRVKSGALKKDPTNLPGEILKDQLPGNWNIDYMQPPALPNYVENLFTALPEMAKTEAGVHEAMVGQAPAGELNAQAIMLLQKAAGVRISRVVRNFRRYMRDVARIWEAFWKEFYTERRLIRITEETGRQFFWFRGTDYADFSFDVKVTSTPTSSYSESVVTSELKEHLDAGRIDFATYLEHVPKTVLPMAEKLLQKLDEAQQQGAQMAQQEAAAGAQGPDPQVLIQQLVSQFPPEQQEQVLQFIQQMSEESLAQLIQLPLDQQVQAIQEALGGGAV